MGGSHHGLGNGGCCKVGEPAEESFDATARDDQHEYDGRSLRETGGGGCRAAPGVFAALVGYIERGEIGPCVALRLPLSQIVAAQQAFLAKSHVGKIVLEL